MGIAYVVIAAVAGAWGYYMLHVRRDMIVERSGRDFDNVLGPLVISLAMIVALVLNFVFAVSSPLFLSLFSNTRRRAQYANIYSPWGNSKYRNAFAKLNDDLEHAHMLNATAATADAFVGEL